MNIKASVRKLRRKSKTYKIIGELLGITPEYARQLANYDFKKCSIHKRQYLIYCKICDIVGRFQKKLNSGCDLKQEAKRLSVRSRTKEMVIQRTMLIKELREKQKMSFVQIGRLLNRHHVTIMYLYDKER